MAEESKATEELPERGTSYSNRDALHVTEIGPIEKSTSSARRRVLSAQSLHLFFAFLFVGLLDKNEIDQPFLRKSPSQLSIAYPS